MENLKSLLPELNAENMKTFQPKNCSNEREYFKHFSETLLEDICFLELIKDIFKCAANGMEYLDFLIWESERDLKTPFRDALELSKKLQRELQKRGFKVMVFVNFKTNISLDVSW